MFFFAQLARTRGIIGETPQTLDKKGYGKEELENMLEKIKNQQNEAMARLWRIKDEKKAKEEWGDLAYAYKKNLDGTWNDEYDTAEEMEKSEQREKILAKTGGIPPGLYYKKHNKQSVFDFGDASNDSDGGGKDDGNGDEKESDERHSVDSNFEEMPDLIDLLPSNDMDADDENDYNTLKNMDLEELDALNTEENNNDSKVSKEKRDDTENKDNDNDNDNVNEIHVIQVMCCL